MKPLFYRRFPVDLGGKGENYHYRVVALDLDALLDFAKSFKPALLQAPPRGGKKIMKSKLTPRVHVPAEHLGIFAERHIQPVSEEHSLLLGWILKEQWYRRYSGFGMTAEAEKKFKLEIRAKLIRLLTSGEWIDEPSTPSHEFLNQHLEKFDLGRRTDLNFSSIQSEASYDQTARFRQGKTRDEVVLPHEDHELPSALPVEEVVVPPTAKSFTDFLKEVKPE